MRRWPSAWVLLWMGLPSQALAQADSCPPHAVPYMTTVSGNVTTVHCRCAGGYHVGGGACVPNPVPLPAIYPTRPVPVSIGGRLSAAIAPFLPDGPMAGVFAHAQAALQDFTENKLKKAVLAGEVIGEEADSPQGVFLAIELNVKRSLPWLTDQIGAAATQAGDPGQVSSARQEALPGQFANRIFDVGAPVNGVLSNGLVKTGSEEVQGKIESGVTGGAASIASSFMPVSAEVRASIAENAGETVDQVKAVISSWKKTGGTSQGGE